MGYKKCSDPWKVLKILRKQNTNTSEINKQDSGWRRNTYRNKIRISVPPPQIIEVINYMCHQTLYDDHG